MAASTPDRLLQLGPKIFAGAGVALLLLAAYMAGQDTMRCERRDGRVDCAVAQQRWFGRVVVERLHVADVVKVGVHTSTTSTTWTTSSGNSETTTTANDVLVLRTRDGRDADTLGGERSGEFADAVLTLVDPKPAPAGADAVTTVNLVDSNWRVAAACGGLGLFIFAFGAIAFFVQRGENG